MTTAKDLLSQIDDIDMGFTGDVKHVEKGRWIVGNEDNFPIQIELLEQKNRFIIYGTGVRETGAAVLSSIMATQFLEHLSGHSLGNYGICPGPVTLTVYQIIQIKSGYNLERLGAEIVCHRMLTECFLEADFDPDDCWPKTVQDLEDISPTIPFHH